MLNNFGACIRDYSLLMSHRLTINYGSIIYGLLQDNFTPRITELHQLAVSISKVKIWKTRTKPHNRSLLTAQQ